MQSTPFRPKLLLIAKGTEARCLSSELFLHRLRDLGELTIVFDGAKLNPGQIAREVRDHDVYLAGWDSILLPTSLAKEPGRLKYVCGITGEMRKFVPVELIDAGIPLTNWGDAPANDVAEGALLLLLASVKSLHARIQWARQGQYRGVPASLGGTLWHLAVGVYGCGVIGRRFIELLRPFEAVVRVFDTFMKETPDGCERVNSLEELFAASEAIVIHSGLTTETRNSVTAELLAMLPDGGIVINTARGGIVDQSALFEELKSGRLRAGLDVLEPDELDAAHPARTWENLILTCHAISDGPPASSSHPRLLRMEQYCLENLRRFIASEPLQFLMDRVRFERST
jgi:phosphoglycerate dehydrogenase-like enzyme